ncbi:MAG: hypothetical protein ACR2PR_11250 [Pseudohongiellaceae bacterium]
MDMLAAPDRRGDNADILPVFDSARAFWQIRQCYLVPDGRIVLCRKAKVGVVFGNNAKHIGTGAQTFNNNNADIVNFVMHKKLRRRRGFGRHRRDYNKKAPPPDTMENMGGDKKRRAG